MSPVTVVLLLIDPATPKNPTLDGSGNSDGRKGDDDVEREPAGALFTHPGILASKYTFLLVNCLS